MSSVDDGIMGLKIYIAKLKFLAGSSKNGGVIGQNKRVRSSSGQSQNCVRLGTSRDKKCAFKSLRVKFFDDHRVSRKKIAGEIIFT